METIIGKEFPQKVIPRIDQAKKTIDVIVFDWRWYPQELGAPVQLFNQAIVRAVRRGVLTRIIANSADIINTLKEVGCQVKKLEFKNLVHCKLMIIDKEIFVIGSHNYTQSAFQMNLELSVILENPDQKTNILNFFDNLWTNHA